MPSANPAADRASTNPASTSVSKSGSSSGLDGARLSRKSRTTAKLNPRLLVFTPPAERSSQTIKLHESRRLVNTPHHTSRPQRRAGLGQNRDTKRRQPPSEVRGCFSHLRNEQGLLGARFWAPGLDHRLGGGVDRVGLGEPAPDVIAPPKVGTGPYGWPAGAAHGSVAHQGLQGRDI